MLCDFGAVEPLSDLDTTLVAMVPRGDRAAAVRAYDHGAYEVIAMPSDELALAKAAERGCERAGLREGLPTDSPAQRDAAPTQAPRRMIGTSSPMQALMREIERVARVDTSVMVTGESGTGKELAARAIHDLSPRASGPFVAVNCGAIPAPLLESELFGHVRGSFTDAVRDKSGLCEQANGGTLFLDEIGELPLELQVKLLRVLQEREIRRIGDDELRAIDVRIVAATVRDLEREVADGRFRQDLFYRLNVVGLRLPPLRERAGDIPALVDHFVARYRVKHGLEADGVTDEAMRVLLGYSWPGNIRELENTIERALVLCDGRAIDVDALADRMREAATEPSQVALSPGELSIKKTMRAVERDLIARALETTEGNRTNAARLLEISHRALLYKIKEYGL